MSSGPAKVGIRARFRAAPACHADRVHQRQVRRRAALCRRAVLASGGTRRAHTDTGDGLQPRRPRTVRVQHVRGGDGERPVRRRHPRRWHVRPGPRAGRLLPRQAVRHRTGRRRGRRPETGRLPGARPGGRPVRAAHARAGHPQSGPLRARHGARPGRPAGDPVPALDRGRGRPADPGELGPAVELDGAVHRRRLLCRGPVALLGWLVAALPRHRDARGSRRRRHRADAVARGRRAGPQGGLLRRGGGGDRCRHLQRLHQRHAAGPLPTPAVRRLRRRAVRDPADRAAGLHAGRGAAAAGPAGRPPVRRVRGQHPPRRPAGRAGPGQAGLLPVQQVQQRPARHHRCRGRRAASPAPGRTTPASA